MGTMKKFSFKAGGVKVSADNKVIAGVLLAHALKEAGVIEFSQDELNSAQPALGQIWEGQGGIYAGIIRGDDGMSYHQIVSTQELRGEWGCSGKEIKAADSRNDGLPNTQAMAAAGSQLAKDALAITADGHTDFYLPSQCELNLCFANAREHFCKEWHWSSTQFSSTHAWSQYFVDGNQYSNAKSSALRARAVRRFLVNSVL